MNSTLNLLQMPDERPAPKVLNKHHVLGDARENSIYIGRPSKFGNPYVINQSCDRAKAIEQFEKWIMTQPQLIEVVKQELKGKNLLCHCAPLRCHGDVLLQIANT